MAEILELSSLPLQLSLALRATSPPLCLHRTTLLSPVGGATCLGLPGHTTNSRSLALIELVFLFGGSCLVNLSLRFALAASLSGHNLYGRLPGSDQLLVSSLSYIRYTSVTTAQEYAGREIQTKTRRKVKLEEALLNIVACYLAVSGGAASLLAAADVSWDDRGWGTSPIRYHTFILFMSLCEDEEDTFRAFHLASNNRLVIRHDNQKVWWLTEDTPWTDVFPVANSSPDTRVVNKLVLGLCNDLDVIYSRLGSSARADFHTEPPLPHGSFLWWVRYTWGCQTGIGGCVSNSVISEFQAEKRNLWTFWTSWRNIYIHKSHLDFAIYSSPASE